jgi:hypothetical protein
MKLHLALAGLGLLFPFAIVAEDEVIIGKLQDCVMSFFLCISRRKLEL